MKPLINFLKVFLAFSLLLAAVAPSAMAQNVKHTKTSQQTTEKNKETVKTLKKKTSSTSNSGSKKAASAAKYQKAKNQTTTSSKPVEYYFRVESQTSSATIKKQSNEGGSEWIDVSTNEGGGYSVNGVPSWCSVSDRESYGFNLTINPNATKESRSGSFDVVSNSSGKSVRIYVSQEPTIPDVAFDNVTVINDDQLSDGRGMTIRFKMSTKNLGGKNCRAVVYFYDSNGNILKDTNNRYSAKDGQVCSGEDFNPSSNNSEYTSFNISIPYKEFHLTGTGKKNVKYRIIAWDGNDALAKTELYSTSFTMPETIASLDATASTGSTTGSSKDSYTPTTTYSSSSSVVKDQKIKTYRPWNKRYWGISVGYVQKQWEASNDVEKMKFGFWDLYDGGEDGHMDGLQAGIRFEPYAKFGLGVNMGVFYEFYYSKSKTMTIDSQRVYGEMMEQALYAPIHLCYRLRFGEFQLFAFGGAGFDYSLSNKMKLKFDGSGEVGYEESDSYDDYNWKRFNVSYEYGGGIRVHSVQATFSMSKGLLDMANSGSYKVKQNKPMMVTLGIMF